MSCDQSTHSLNSNLDVCGSRPRLSLDPSKEIALIEAALQHELTAYKKLVESVSKQRFDSRTEGSKPKTSVSRIGGNSCSSQSQKL